MCITSMAPMITSVTIIYKYFILFYVHNFKDIEKGSEDRNLDYGHF